MRNLFISVIILCIGFCGCDNRSSTDNTTRLPMELLLAKEAGNKIPALKEFYQLYKVSPIFGYQDLPVEKAYSYTASALVVLYSRYELECVVLFNASQDRKLIANFSEPRIEINEITKVTYESSNSCVSKVIGWHYVVSPDEWAKIVENKGDISKVLPKIEKDKPVKNIEFITDPPPIKDAESGK